MPSVDFRLLLVTDRSQTGGRPLQTVLRQAIQAGVPAIQLRDRDLSTRELLALAQAIRAVADPASVPLLINDRIDFALAMNLAGVHLRANSVPVAVARRLLGPQRLIGASTHSVEEAIRAGRDGADYIVYGPVFETPSKRSYGKPLGLQALADVCRRTPVPVLAIGGVTRERVREIRDAGAHGIAVVGAILGRENVVAATQDLLAAISG